FDYSRETDYFWPSAYYCDDFQAIRHSYTASTMVSGLFGSKWSSVQKLVNRTSSPVFSMLCVHIVGISIATGSSPVTSKFNTSLVNIWRSEIRAFPESTKKRSTFRRW